MRIKFGEGDAAHVQETGGGLNVGYLLRLGLHNWRRNRGGAASSVAVLLVCLLLLGGAMLFVANILKVINTVQSENIIMVFARYEASDEQVEQLGQMLRYTEGVGELQFISKEEAFNQQLELLEGSSAAQLAQSLPQNPLPDAYRVTVTDMSEFGEVAERIKALPNVESLRENRELSEKLTQLSRAAQVVGLAVVLLLLVGATLVIMNTTRLSMQKNEKAIGLMRRVGSTERDVRIPYLVEGLVNGLLAIALAFLAVWGLYSAAIARLRSFTDAFFTGDFLPFWDVARWLLPAYLVVGLLTGFFGCLLSVRIYVREEKKRVD
jgi:cell division transport system permease protein